LTAHIKNLRFSCFYQINVISSLSLSISLSLKFYNKVDSGFLWNHIFCCYSTIQQGAVTDLSRTISNRRLRLFYFIKLYFKSELFDLYLTAEIQNRVKLCKKHSRKSRSDFYFYKPMSIINRVSTAYSRVWGMKKRNSFFFK
jgi:hypothetical protein